MKIFFVSLGCDKNLVDSEKMISLLMEKGHTITDDEYEAEVAVVNTCSFILDAKNESIENILSMVELKKEGNLKSIIVCGCLAQRYAEELREELPEVDAFLGTFAIEEIVKAIEETTKNKVYDSVTDINAPLDSINRSMVTTAGHFAYLKISDGCDKKCTYCAIPRFKGGYRSYPMEMLVEEATRLVTEIGVKELILVGQETTLYGTDLYGEKKLTELIDKLSKIPGVNWIRLLYCYPEEIDESLVKCMAENNKVCHYIDMPIQSAANDVLKRMGRRVTVEDIREKVTLLREYMPDICIRTTLISGFPGETEEDHKKTKAFIKEIKFDRLGVFAYSKEEGTPAYKMKPQILKKVKVARRDELMAIQQKIAFKKAAALKGKKLMCMIEGRLPEDNVYIGRTYMDAPNVDGFVFISSDYNFCTGDMVLVKITGSNEYDLIGVVCDESC